MTKKVRFNDNVQVKKMSIDLAGHAKEVKLAKDIIINPDKTLPPNIEMLNPDIETEKGIGYKDKMCSIPNFFFWILVGIILIIILGIFSTTNAGKSILLGKE